MGNGAMPHGASYPRPSSLPKREYRRLACDTRTATLAGATHAPFRGLFFSITMPL
jgi:hypothetical protein